MERYRNLSGNSGVVAYATGDDYIDIRFREDGTYRYTYEIPGREDVEEMKRLAQAGRGLSTYISTHVKGRYASKADD